MQRRWKEAWIMLNGYGIIPIKELALQQRRENSRSENQQRNDPYRSADRIRIRLGGICVDADTLSNEVI
jgi:hypothetical protein